MSRWTQEDIDRVSAQRVARQRGQTAQSIVKPSKYRNTKITIGDQKFDSKKEARLWSELQLREKAGEIYDLKRQVPFALNCPVRFESINGFAEVASYIADFVWRDYATNQLHVADCKGGRATMTKDFRLKMRWLALQDGIAVEIL